MPCYGMPRRLFLQESVRAVAGCTLLPLAGSVGMSPPGIPRRAGAGSIQGAALEELISGLMKDASVPGVSIAVIKDSRLAWQRSFGVRHSSLRTPVDSETVFDVASVSKTVFAYAAMKLCEKGVIGLDAPLSKYTLERFLQGDARLDRITARHVLSHSSGFQNWRSKSEPLRIHFEPGERFLYSGEGYFYLQSVMTYLTGRRDATVCSRYEADLEVCATDIGRYLTANLLTPFAMTSSGYDSDDQWERRAAQPHDVEGKPLQRGPATATGAARYAAAGGLHTTATDYAKFLIEIIQPRPSDAFRLTRRSIQEMLRPHVKVDESTSWALGWQVRHTPKGDVIQHQGGQGGFQAFAAASVEQQAGFVILTNSANGGKVFYDRRFSEAMDRILLHRV